MSDDKAQIGMIGMGVMGSNLARNMARHGYRTAIWNIDPALTHEVAEQHADEGTFIPSDTLEDFVNSLSSPRTIMMMITAGKPVDIVCGELKPLLDKGDIIIDGGNSLFKDTIRRESELRADGLEFVGCGISGGEVGALEGPSIMPGGSKESYQTVGPILETISAKFHGPNGDEPCCAWIGPNGAGHFVKMIHNGIEYADMELIGEAFDLLKATGMSYPEMADVFRQWNSTDLESYLIEITADVLEKVDAKTGKPLVEVILDQAGMKGTGTWTVETALELGSPTSAIAEAVFARAISSHTDLRDACQPVLHGPERKLPADLDVPAFVEDLRRALWSSKVVAYAQGLDEIRTGGQQYGWDIDMASVAKIWRAGCVIRAQLLDRISNEYAAHDLVTLLVAQSVAEELAKYQDAWRRVVATAVTAGVPMPAFSATLAYYDAARSERLSAALVQGQRDYFGSHTYRRVDADGVFHTLWSGDGSEEQLPTA